MIGRGASPDWSPSGASIAFATGDALVVSRPDGTAPRMILRSSLTVDQPSWSADGKRIVYAVFAEKNRLTSRGLRIIDVDGGHPRVLTRSGYDPDWRPR